MDVAKLPHIVSSLHFKRCENRKKMDERERNQSYCSVDREARSLDCVLASQGLRWG